LLSAIALHKLLKQAEHHSAAKRSLQRETAPRTGMDCDWLANAVAGREVDPAAAAAVADELDALLAGLTPMARQIVEMRLADYTHEEIATAVERSDRTVRRILADVQRQWQNRSTR
ncbi:MAG: sigma factor-like helix-turn-helix DNA-binding protein, partial [Pirellulaceae bacterium]